VNIFVILAANVRRMTFRPIDPIPLTKKVAAAAKEQDVCLKKMLKALET
jgi:hypothetical protein